MKEIAKKQQSKTKSISAGAKKEGGFMWKLLIIALVVAIACVSVLGFMSYSRYLKMKDVVNIEKIYPNIFVNGVNIGDLTKEQALEKLQEAFMPALLEKNILVKSEDKQLKISFTELGASYDFMPAVDEAFAYARTGSMKARYEQIIMLNDTPKEITYEPGYSYDVSGVEESIADFADALRVEPVNATCVRKNGKFIITPEQLGHEVDVEETAVRVIELIASNNEGEVDALMLPVQPEFVAADFEKAKTLIGSYETTYVGTLDNPRNINIQTAAAKINDYVVYPDEIFSTNAAFGDMTYQNGYRTAPVIVSGKLVDDYGGGVCQVSSTLYNALLYAELEIVERQNHSLKVGYVDYGFDATLAGTYIDLKFRNDTAYPVFIESYLEGNKVKVNIYGHEVHDPSRKLVFSNALIQTTPPAAELVVEDPGLPLGERVVKEPARTGYKYAMYKTVYEHGVEIDKVTVNQSTYKATRAEILVGTGPAESDQTARNEPQQSTSPDEPPDYGADQVQDDSGESDIQAPSDTAVTELLSELEQQTPPPQIVLPPEEQPVMPDDE